MNRAKPTTLLTGFLGSGKTSYLNHLIQINPTTRYAIIENEFGEESIDGELILRAADEIVELNNGCLCCSLNENLYQILDDLHQRKDEFDELIIEATGIADPAGIAEAFIAHPAIRKGFDLIRTICLIDAELITTQIETIEEVSKQIAFSDILLINKTDLVNESVIADLKQKLAQINPNARVIPKEKNEFPSDILPVAHHQKVLQSMNQAPCNVHHHHNCDHEHEPAKISNHSHQHSQISTHTFVFDELFHLTKLYYQLTVYLKFQAADLYRIKGFLAVHDSDEKHLLQSVGKRIIVEPFSPWEAGEMRKSRIVFIGKNLKPEGLLKMIEKCLQ